MSLDRRLALCFSAEKFDRRLNDIGAQFMVISGVDGGYTGFLAHKASQTSQCTKRAGFPCSRASDEWIAAWGKPRCGAIHHAQTSTCG